MTPELFLSCGGELRDIEEELSEYVRYCYGYLSKFSFFSLSPCPFSQSSFRTDSYSNEYLLAKFGFDTAENEPCKDCPLSAYRSPRYDFDARVDVPLHLRSLRVVAQQGVERRMFFFFSTLFLFLFFISKVLIDAVQ